MPDRSKAMNQTKRDTLVLQVGVWDLGVRLTLPSKNVDVEKTSEIPRGGTDKQKTI